MFYDRDGTPITPEAWRERWNSGPEYRRVALDRVGEVDVSTVWLGLDQRPEHGPPLIFETLVFGGPFDGELRRYATEAAALAGHRETVRLVRSAEERTWPV